MFSEYKIFLNPKSNVFKFALALLGFSIFTLLFNYDFSVNFLAFSGNGTFYAALSIFFILHLIFFVYIYTAKAYLKDKFLNPINIYITLNILFLILHPTLSLSIYLIPFVFITTIFLNRIARFNRQPIFNPVAFGVFISFLVLFIFKSLGLITENIFVSWWGANLIKGIPPFNILQIFLGLLFMAGFFYLAKKNNKLIYGSIFIGLVILGQLIFAILEPSTSFSFINYILGILSGNLAFFGLVMLIEPKTSPIKLNHQIILGILAAIIYTLSLEFLPKLNLNEFGVLLEIFVILIMNLIFFGIKRIKLNAAKD